MTRRCVVTGMGVLSPIGCCFESFVAALRRGDCGLTPLREISCDAQIDIEVGGEIRNLSRHIPPQLDRSSRHERLALAASHQAIEQANVSFGEMAGEGLLMLATALGPCDIIEDRTHPRPEGVPGLDRQLIQLTLAAIIDALGFTGESILLTNGCAAANYALTYAKDTIAQGRHDVALVGGVDTFAHVCLAGYDRFGILASRSRPFDAHCDGIAVGEGAGFVVLEAEGHARARGAEIHAEIAGGAGAVDAYQMLSPDPEGQALLRSMRAALEDAGETPQSVDYISAGATGTPVGDQAEARAIKKLFGNDSVPSVSATKSQTGNCHGASGMLEALACVAAIKHGFLPPTINVEQPNEECTFDIVPAARNQAVSVTLNNATGFGGADSSVVIRRHR